MELQYPEYQRFFEELLCNEGEDLSKYDSLFDFRPQTVKRREFGKKYKLLLSQLIDSYGLICRLQCSEQCNIGQGYNVDHVIPLSSNKLNKELRKTKALSGKKVATESFGSNHINNLVIACKKCNSFKKHRFLSKAEMKRILVSKGF